ncbi:MAG: hypothetical protein WD036_08830 [Bauldia sp.]
MTLPDSAKWVPMASAPRDGTLVLARVRATEQGPAEIDAVRWAVSARSDEGNWIANDSDPFARVAYAEVELAGWMPLPTQVAGPRSEPAVAEAEPADDESDGSAI